MVKTSDIPGRPAGWQSRTYRLDAALVARLDEVTAEKRLFPSDLVRFLLGYALDQVDAGALVIPTTPALNVIVPR
jgi:hypothetical protein